MAINHLPTNGMCKNYHEHDYFCDIDEEDTAFIDNQVMMGPSNIPSPSILMKQLWHRLIFLFLQLKTTTILV